MRGLLLLYMLAGFIHVNKTYCTMTIQSSPFPHMINTICTRTRNGTTVHVYCTCNLHRPVLVHGIKVLVLLDLTQLKQQN